MGKKYEGKKHNEAKKMKGLAVKREEEAIIVSVSYLQKHMASGRSKVLMLESEEGGRGANIGTV